MPDQRPADHRTAASRAAPDSRAAGQAPRAVLPAAAPVTGKSARMRRRERTRATSTSRALAPWLLLVAAVAAAGIYYQMPAREAAEPLAVRHVLPSDPDPVARFNDTRVGHVLFMEPDGRHCRRILFDNETGGMRPVGDIECVPQEAASGPAGSGRLDAIREGFRR